MPGWLFFKGVETFGFQEGDRIGLVRNSQGALHYYINGMDQGLAASNTPSPVWGVVDLYGMAVKVTILDCHDPSYPNNPPAPERRANSLFRHYPDLYDEEALEGVLCVSILGDSLQFVNNNYYSLLFCVLFLQIGAHSPLQSKEPKQSNFASIHACTHACIHTNTHLHPHTHPQTHTHTESIGQLEEVRFEK